MAIRDIDMDGFGSLNARLTAQMYQLCSQNSNRTRQTNARSDQIALPKGSVLDAMKKKEKEEAEAASQKKETAKKEEPAPAETPPRRRKLNRNQQPEPQPALRRRPAPKRLPLLKVSSLQNLRNRNSLPQKIMKKIETPRLKRTCRATIDLTTLSRRQKACRQKGRARLRIKPRPNPSLAQESMMLLQRPPPLLRNQRGKRN